MRTAIILAGFFSTNAGQASAQLSVRTGLAQHHYASKDYYRAITEYKRESFFAVASHRKRWAEYRIGECYRKSGRPEMSVTHLANAAWFGAFDDLTDSCALSLARSYIAMGLYPAARGILDSLSETPVKSALSGWSYLLEGDFERARSRFARAGRDSLVSLALACQQTAWRSPRAAGFMSAIIPGSGQFYSGGYRQGVTSFLLHALLGYVTYRAVEDERYFEAAAAVYTGFSRFYVGNIMSAYDLARTHNQEKMSDLVERGIERHGRDLD